MDNEKRLGYDKEFDRWYAYDGCDYIALNDDLKT